MAKATLVTNNGLTRVYSSSTGQQVRLEMNDEFTEIKFIDDTTNEGFGEFEFKDLENGYYKLMRMYTEPNKGGGIGRAALEMFKEITDAEIVTSPDDGMPRDDGSHLTQDAPGFVSKMIKEGLILENNGDDFPDDDEDDFVD
jgi:hypothetical protein